MVFFKYIFSILFVIFIGFNSVSQTDTEFWFVAPEVTINHGPAAGYLGGEPIFLRFSTFNLPATITISQPANTVNFPPIIINVGANATQSINLTDLGLQNQIENAYDYSTNGKSNKGILIESTSLITVYYEVSTPNNPDIFALKGKNALGIEFFTPFQNVMYNMTQNAWDVQANSSIDIVATEDNTIITIETTKDIYGHEGETTFTDTLNRGETMSYAPARTTVPFNNWMPADTFGRAAADHLTGCKITTNGKKIAVTISDDSMKHDDGCYDLSGDQLVPTDIIGTEYIAMKGQLNSGEQIFVVATQDNTEIFINTVSQTTINTGETYVYSLIGAATHIRATEDIYVLQISGFGCEMGGAILPPINVCTGSTQVGFTRSTDQGFFLNLMVRTGAEDAFLLNGLASPLITAGDFAVIPGTTNWLAARIGPIAVGNIPVGAQSLISNTEDLFHMGIINGSTSGGCRFGYFSDFNELSIDAIVAGTGTPVIKACYGDSAQLISTGGITYIWSPAATLTDANIATPVAFPLSTTKYTVVVSGACNMLDSASITVKVASPLEAKFSINNSSCPPFEAPITNISSGGSKFYWSFGDNDSLYTTSDSSLYHTYNNFSDSLNVYNITLIAANAYDCTDTTKKTISVFPDITAQFITDSNICHLDTATFSNSSTGVDSYYWEFGDGGASSIENPVHIYQNYSNTDTIFTSELITTSSYYCKDTLSKNIRVHPYIKSLFTFNYNSQCTPFEVIFENSSFGGIQEYFWDFGDGDTITTDSDSSITHTYYNNSDSILNITAKLIVKNTGECNDTFSRQLSIYPEVIANFSNDSIGCHPFPVNFTNNSSGASTYHWEYGDGGSSNSINPSHTFSNLSNDDTIYTTSLIVRSDNFCFDTINKDIGVYAYLEADFSIDNSTGCTQFSSQIDNSSKGADYYTWIFSNSDTINTLSDSSFFKTFTNPTDSLFTVYITLIAYQSDKCSDTITREILVYPNITASFSSDTLGCHPYTLPFSNLSSGANQYDWNFGDGASSNENSPTHTYNNIDSTLHTYTVSMIASYFGSCSDTAYSEISTYPFLSSNFSIDISEGCTPLSIPTDYNSSGANHYFWEFGNGDTLSTNIDTSFTLTYENATDSLQSYNIKLIVYNSYNCTDTTVKTISVYPKTNTSFSCDTLGCHPYILSFTNLTTGANLFSWDFGDGSSSDSINTTHTFNNTDTINKIFRVKLEASYNGICSDTFSKNIEVYPYLNADFVLNAGYGCSPLNFSLTNNSTGASDYFWSFGNGDTLNTNSDSSISLSYTNTTDSVLLYHISLITYNDVNCTDTASKTISVFPNAVSDFTSDSTGCHPLTVNFTNNSSGANTFIWNFGDGGFSDSISPTHTFNNTNPNDTNYIVQLITSYNNQCYDTSYSTVTIYPYLNANFIFDNNEGCSPLNVPISNISNGATSYLWDFGNGDTLQTTSDSSISIHYTNASDSLITNDITLIVYNNLNCTDTLTKTIAVYPIVDASFSSDTIGCHPYPVQFTNSSSGANNYYWNFGDGGSSDSINPLHVFNNYDSTSSIFTTELIATYNNSCNDTITKNIYVYPYLNANFTFPKSADCTPFTISVTNNSSGAESYFWNFGNNDTILSDSDTSFTRLYTNSSDSLISHTIRLVVSNTQNCTDTIEKNISVYSNINAQFEPDTNIGCNPLTINFTNNSSGGNSFIWDFGDGGSSNQKEPTHEFSHSSTNDTSFIVSLITSYDGGACAKVITDTITVFSYLDANFTFPYSSGCTPFSVDITNSSIGASNQNWDFGNDSSSTISDSVFSYLYTNNTDTIQNYTITHTVTNSHRCIDSLPRLISLYPKITALFIPDTNYGCNPLTISFQNNSSGANQYLWEFGDGGSDHETNPSHTYTNNSNTGLYYTVSLFAESGSNCKDTNSVDILVLPNPEALFSTNYDNTTACSPYTINIINNSTNNCDYYWQFGDNDSLYTDSDSSIIHTYINSSSESINNNLVLIIEDDTGCTDNYVKNISIHPEVISDFTFDSIGCSPFTQQLINKSEKATEYSWTFSNNQSSSNLTNPPVTFEYNGYSDTSHTISLIASYGNLCPDTTIKTIYIHPTPTANFSASPDSQYYPSTTVDIINQSTLGNWNFHWDFGDNDTLSTISNSIFSHNYSTWGSFSIQLTTTNAYCSDTANQIITIFMLPPNAQFSSSPTEGCFPFIVQFTNNSENDSLATYKWYVDYNNSDFYLPSENPTYKYSSPGSYNVILIVEGPSGIKDTSDISTINVYPKPVAFFEVLPNVVQIPEESITCHNRSSDDAILFHWDFGDDIGTSTEKSPSYTYKNAGEYYIELITTTNNGCKDTTEEFAEASTSNEVKFPNAFTPATTSSPNGFYDSSTDIKNQIFHPIVRGEINEYQLIIFNRWGEMIFESNDIAIGWDGYYKNKACEQGVYFFKAKGKYSNNKLFSITGDITLLK